MKLTGIANKIWFSPIVASVIFYLSTIKSMPEAITIDYTNDIVHTPSGEELISLTFCRDTIGHCCFYMLLAFALFFDLKKSCRLTAKVQATLSILGPILFGVSMELVQKYFFPPRAFEWSDIIANSAGCLAGYFLARHYSKKKA